MVRPLYHLKAKSVKNKFGRARREQGHLYGFWNLGYSGRTNWKPTAEDQREILHAQAYIRLNSWGSLGPGLRGQFRVLVYK